VLVLDGFFALDKHALECVDGVGESADWHA